MLIASYIGAFQWGSCLKVQVGHGLPIQNYILYDIQTIQCYETLCNTHDLDWDFISLWILLCYKICTLF